jgi:hypothetical protein
MRKIDFDILDFFLILFEFSIGFMLGIEMWEDLIIDSEFEGFSLLDDVECESIEGEGVLEGYVCW